MLEAAGGFGIIAGGLLLSLWGGFKRRAIIAIDQAPAQLAHTKDD